MQNKPDILQENEHICQEEGGICGMNERKGEDEKAQLQCQWMIVQG